MRLHRDVFPAEAYCPAVESAPIRNARVFVTDSTVQIWRTRTRHAELVLDARLLSEAPERTRGTQHGQLHLVTDKGDVHVTKGRGCGCHSALTAVSAPASW